MDTLLQLLLFAGALVWLPPLVRFLCEPQPVAWFLTPGTLRAALILLLSLYIGGWAVLLGEAAMCAALGAWLVSGQLAAYLATQLTLRSQILATLATSGSPQSQSWRYLRLILLSTLVARGEAARGASSAIGDPRTRRLTEVHHDE